MESNTGIKGTFAKHFSNIKTKHNGYLSINESNLKKEIEYLNSHLKELTKEIQGQKELNKQIFQELNDVTKENRMGKTEITNYKSTIQELQSKIFNYERKSQSIISHDVIAPINVNHYKNNKYIEDDYELATGLAKEFELEDQEHEKVQSSLISHKNTENSEIINNIKNNPNHIDNNLNSMINEINLFQNWFDKRNNANQDEKDQRDDVPDGELINYNIDDQEKSKDNINGNNINIQYPGENNGFTGYIPYNDDQEQEEDNIFSLINNNEEHHVPNIDEMTYEEIVAFQNQIGFVNKGLNNSVIKKGNVIEYNSNLKEYTSEDCMICGEEYNQNEKIKMGKCGHGFHIHCIDKWLLQDKKCPYCNQQVI